MRPEWFPLGKILSRGILRGHFLRVVEVAIMGQYVVRFIKWAVVISVSVVPCRFVPLDWRSGKGVYFETTVFIH